MAGGGEVGDDVDAEELEVHPEGEDGTCVARVLGEGEDVVVEGEVLVVEGEDVFDCCHCWLKGSRV